MKIINEFVFAEQYDNLLNLSTAITDIGIRILNLHDQLPDELRERVDKILGREISAIDSTCHCLGIVAEGAAEQAEAWKMLALKHGLQITPDSKGVAA